MEPQNLGTSILDAFKKDSQDVQNDKDYNDALQEEINKQLKAIADYDANPELLDSKIRFNPEEFDFNEKKISHKLYIEEDGQYPPADDPEELIKSTFAGLSTLMDGPNLDKDEPKKFKIKVCKDKSLIDAVYKIDVDAANRRDYVESNKTYLNDYNGNWEDEYVDLDTLGEYINKGYGIKINC